MRPTWKRHAALVGALVLMVATLVWAPQVHAAPPDGFQTSLLVADGLDGPSGMEIAPDGRIFILERAGKVKIYKNGQLIAQPFVDLPSEATGDRGLIGVAFDPDYGVSNHYVYFYYTGHDLLNHLVRFNASEDVATDGPYELFRTSSPSQLLHVGGSIRFGPDGKLYFAVGDNGDGALAQRLDNPHGKILRINKDGSIPEDNPFFGQPGKLGAIWAYGFRNPWRFQFDSQTGKLYVGDVGNYTWDELDRVVKGGNYGWPIHEGPCTSGCEGFIEPIHAYHHNGGTAAVTSGPVYHGAMFPEQYRGNLFFADYALGWIKRAELDTNGNVTAVHDFDPQAGTVTDLKVAPDGSMYYITYWPGELYRISYNTESQVPVAQASADVTKGIEPLTVNFSSAGSNDPDGDPLTYRWSFGDGTSSTEPNPTKTYTGKGTYTARLTVSDGQSEAIAPPISIQVGIPPTLTVASPTDGEKYRAGDTIKYTAFATDAAGFDLNDGDIKTEVRLHHLSHYHPFVGPLTGRAGSFTIPATGEASADTSYEIKVTATDGNGLSTTKTVEIFPHRSQMTFETSPSGLGLKLDAIPVATPHTITGVEGFKRELLAADTVVAADGTPMQFAGWSDGKSIRHLITTPRDDTTYTATYKPTQPFTAKYFDNTNLTGTPVLTRQDPAIDFAWGDGSPDPAVPVDNFSVRWMKTQAFGSGRYKFTAVADDGVRLYIDGKRVIDQWQGPVNTEFTYVTELGAGNHKITMEYVEHGWGAAAKLSWASTPDQPDHSYRAQYWNLAIGDRAVPSRTPDIVRDEDEINHEWGPDSPAPEITRDLFAARWTRTLSVVPGEYEFTTTTDDGVRLYVDGVRVIDKWVNQAPTTYTARLPLDGGPHTIVMEYYEDSAGALARLAYRQVGDLPEQAAYQAQFWNTADAGTGPIPSREADLSRQDEALDFDWGSGPPGPGINPDLFVARWTRTDVLSAGLYRFTGSFDDGIRVYVDNVLIVDKWLFQSGTYSVNKVLSAGAHVIRIDYFESGGGARVGLDYQRIGDVVPEEPGFQAEYFANRDLAGAPVLTRSDQTIDFEWGSGSPGDEVPVDNFSARWTKPIVLADGNYAFTVTSDDGIRLFVDGVKVLDKWLFQAPTTYSVTRHLTEGTHDIVVEYFEGGAGAVARFGYAPTESEPPPPPPPAVPFHGEYFDNPTLSGSPLLTRPDEAVDFDWGPGSPAPTIPTENFSARWTRTKDYAAGLYRFTATGDDGIRVYVDGNIILNGWLDQAPTTYTALVSLTEGQHTVAVEYYERGGGSVARLTEVPE